MTSKQVSSTNKPSTPGIILVVLMAIVALSLVLKQLRHAENENVKVDTRLESEAELVMILLVSSKCGACRIGGLAEALDEMRVRLGQLARSRERRLVTHGVALDWSVEEGLEFLAGFGAWDEVSVGRNWLNSAALKYIWKDGPQFATVPQVVVVERVVQVSDGNEILVRSEEVVQRVAGPGEIFNWIEEARSHATSARLSNQVNSRTDSTRRTAGKGSSKEAI